MVEIRLRKHHLMLVRFIPPAIPVPKPASPTGPDWLHEVKFDGWRLQIHKSDDRVKLYSRRGVDMAKRFPDLRDACLYLPETVIDAELVACDTDGKPDFMALRRPQPKLVCVVFRPAGDCRPGYSRTAAFREARAAARACDRDG